jgi:hypothetical protein
MTHKPPKCFYILTVLSTVQFTDIMPQTSEFSGTIKLIILGIDVSVCFFLFYNNPPPEVIRLLQIHWKYTYMYVQAHVCHIMAWHIFAHYNTKT